MATFNHFEDFSEALSLAQHNLNTDTFRAYLTNATPSASLDADKADLAEIATGNGYTGAVDIQNAMTESGGTSTMTAVDATITASGGSVGPFRYVPIFNDDHSTDGMMGWYDYGAPITIADGESFLLDFGAAVYTVAQP